MFSVFFVVRFSEVVVLGLKINNIFLTSERRDFMEFSCGVWVFLGTNSFKINDYDNKYVVILVVELNGKIP